ncbi:MAG: response regulator transcription factor [Woeseia sp.]|nr:response regulator transcription factor [Woeseia sp.]MBT8097588.1 response regulator transcription factor [Woeseia sp.]NNE61421.1 response regulator transcription factor [Woeseia sp.]NNL53903.1 response regulator transcription factor [Woeseia sp.]
MRIALLEDDPDQVSIYTLWLQNSEHSVKSHGTAADFLRAVRRDSFDLYLLDWMLPDLSGIDVLLKLRGEMQDFTPVLIATAKDQERNVVQALEAGADDYLVKPLRQKEMLARVDALARRASGGRPKHESFDADPYMLDMEKKRVAINGTDVTLTSREFDLAAFFFQNAGRVVSRSHILEAIWGIENADVSTRTVDTHISRLRKKMQLNKSNGWKLSAIYQHGYRLEKQDTVQDQ